MCQCPQAGSYHFYTSRWTGQSLRVSMPSGGLIPFLLTPYLIFINGFGRCVNALRRAYTISTYGISEKWVPTAWCQCPLAGLYHFYEPKPDFERPDDPGVNALRRAYTISTLPPQKPFIYAGFQPRFCRYFSEYSDNLAK